ncbi:MAG: IclR family transcriptional regulator [Burkholderiaceae bacterium]
MSQQSSSPPKGIQSATVALSVLRALIESGRPLYLREIAAAAGMASSNVYRYLVSFTEAEMVVQDSSTGRYDLGPLAIELGLAALRRVDAVDIAVEKLGLLVDSMELDGHVTVWGSGGPTVIRSKQGSRQIAVKIAEGITLPLLNSATGRVWAAFFAQGRVASAVDKEVSAAARTQRVSKDTLRARFSEEIQEIQRRGLAASSGERRSGIDALCVPVLDRDGELALTLTLVGFTGRMDVRPKGQPATALREAAEQITRRLGGDAAIIARYGWRAAAGR